MRRRLGGGLVIALGLLSPTVRGDVAVDALRLLDQGVALYKANDLLAARAVKPGSDWTVPRHAARCLA